MTLLLAESLANEVVADIDAAVRRLLMASLSFISVIPAVSGCEHSMHISKHLTQVQQYLAYGTADGNIFIAIMLLRRICASMPPALCCCVCTGSVALTWLSRSVLHCQPACFDDTQLAGIKSGLTEYTGSNASHWATKGSSPLHSCNPLVIRFQPLNDLHDRTVLSRNTSCFCQRDWPEEACQITGSPN